MTQATIGGIILLAAVILFVIRIIPAPVTAILGCAAFSLFGICSISEAFSGFSNSVVILVAAMMIFGSAMNKTGLSALIGDFVIKLSKGSERRFIFFGGLCAYVMSAFLSNTAVNVMFLTVISAMAVSDRKIKRMDLVFPIVLCTMFGGVSTLVGSTTQLTAQGILESESGVGFGVFDFTLPGVILFALYMLYALVIGYPLGKRIWGAREETEEENTTREKAHDKKKIIILLVIFALLVVVFIGAWIDISLAAVIAAMLCIITGCTDFKSGVGAINWSVIFVLAGCLGITKGLSACGADVMIGNFVSDIIGKSTPPIAVFAIIVTATMLVSNFITNSAAVMIFLPIAISLCEAMNLNVNLFAMGIVFAASLSFSTPLANAQMGMALSAGYGFSDYIRYTWLLDIIVLILIVALFPILIPIAV